MLEFDEKDYDNDYDGCGFLVGDIAGHQAGYRESWIEWLFGVDPKRTPWVSCGRGTRLRDESGRCRKTLFFLCDAFLSDAFLSWLFFVRNNHSTKPPCSADSLRGLNRRVLRDATTYDSLSSTCILGMREKTEDGGRAPLQVRISFR